MPHPAGSLRPLLRSPRLSSRAQTDVAAHVEQHIEFIFGAPPAAPAQAYGPSSWGAEPRIARIPQEHEIDEAIGLDLEPASNLATCSNTIGQAKSCGDGYPPQCAADWPGA